MRNAPAALSGAGGFALVLILIVVWQATPDAQTARVGAAAAPTPPLVAPSAGPALPAGLVAYDAPGGAALGLLPGGVSYRVLAQAHGGAWLQVEAGHGPVWIEAQSGMLRPAALADLTPPTPVPTPAIQIVYVERPVIVAAPAPAPAAALTEQPPADWPGVPFVLDPPPAPAAPDCPLVLSPARLEACLAGEP